MKSALIYVGLFASVFGLSIPFLVERHTGSAGRNQPSSQEPTPTKIEVQRQTDEPAMQLVEQQKENDANRRAEQERVARDEREQQELNLEKERQAQTAVLQARKSVAAKAAVLRDIFEARGMGKSSERETRETLNAIRRIAGDFQSADNLQADMNMVDDFVRQEKRHLKEDISKSKLFDIKNRLALNKMEMDAEERLMDWQRLGELGLERGAFSATELANRVADRRQEDRRKFDDYFKTVLEPIEARTRMFESLYARLMNLEQ